MKRMRKPQTFRQQMVQSMAELRSIMQRGQSPTADGRLTVRTVEVVAPREYDPGAVLATREALGVSQAVFARVMGVSDVLVRSWERGARTPAPVARRLMDYIRAHPADVARPVRPVGGAATPGIHRRRAVA